MNIALRKWLFPLAMAALCAFAGTAPAQNTEPATPPVDVEAQDAPTTEAPDAEVPAVEAADARTQDENASDDRRDRGPRDRRLRDRWRDRNHQNDRVVVGGDATLEKGQRANSVVSVFGNSTSDGDVSDAVVSIGGDTRVTGTAVDVVAVLGSVYLNGRASGDVVATLGDVELGPEAEVGGDVVVVGGTLKRDPAAVIHGGVQNVMSFATGSFEWFQPWARHCLLLLRPLAIAPGLGWAWGLALGFLALYVLIGVLFRSSVDHCVRTFEQQPGKSIIAALLTTMLTPVVFALLFITIIGIALVPVAALGLFLVSVFGKAVMLAWIGRSCLRLSGERSAAVHTALAVLIGGVIITALYLVPFVGFIVYKALGILGLGVTVYALILTMKQKRADNGPPLAMAGAPAGGGSAAFAEPTIGGADTAGSERDYYASAPTSGTQPFTGRGFDATGDSRTGGAESDELGTSGDERAAGAGRSAGEPPRHAHTIDTATALTYPRAGFGVRMAALFIDLILVAVLLGIVDSSKDAVLIALALYGAVMWKLKGTTIGGIVFGLQVLRVDGRPIDWATATVRALSCFLSLVVAGLGFIWIAFDDGRQAWHDKIAGTAVVRVPKGVSLL
jgi:uncharacterized RDD family membrane protein YckC